MLNNINRYPAMRLCLRGFLCLVVLTCGFGGLSEAADMIISAPPEPPLRAAPTSLAAGAELIPFFERLPDEATISPREELPLIAVLKNTLYDSDPSNDRIRQVWVFT